MPDDLAAAPDDAVPTAYILVDGENIEGALRQFWGGELTPDKRPRWSRLPTYVSQTWQAPVKALFFLNATSGVLPFPFMQFLIQAGYTPLALAGERGQEVVDLAIQQTMRAILDRPGDVVLVSHDGGFADHVAKLLDAGRRVAVVGFQEQLSGDLSALVPRGLGVVDIEDTARLLEVRVPNRLRVIRLEDFDPTRYL